MSSAPKCPFGSEASTIGSVHVTREVDAARTLETHQIAFRESGLEEALSRVIAIVVQPGVEFDHTQIIHYQPQAAQALSAWIKETPMVYEAHSTDYQTRQAYRALVRDHYAILKVGPALTFALREAVFALAQMENELVSPEQRSRVMEVIDEVMLNERLLEKYYRPTEPGDGRYSFQPLRPNPLLLAVSTHSPERRENDRQFKPHRSATGIAQPVHARAVRTPCRRSADRYAA